MPAEGGVAMGELSSGNVIYKVRSRIPMFAYPSRWAWTVGHSVMGVDPLIGVGGRPGAGPIFLSGVLPPVAFECFRSSRAGLFCKAPSFSFFSVSVLGPVMGLRFLGTVPEGDAIVFF